MLTLKDLQYNFLFLKFLTTLNIFPVDLNRRTGKMRLKHGLVSKLMFKLWRLIIVSHSVQVTLKTGHSMLFEEFNLIESPLMILSSAAYLLASNFGSFIIFQFRPDIVVRLFNEFHELHLITYFEVADVVTGPEGKKSKQRSADICTRQI